MARKQKYCGNGDSNEKNFVQSNTIASDLSPGLEDDMVDRAAIYLTQAVEYPPLTPEAERAIVRKIDWIVLPMLLLTATLGAVDKVALGTAALYGLREDLGLKGQTYAWAGSILPIGVSDAPFAAVFTYTMIRIGYLGSVSMAWSIFAFIFLPNSPMDARFLTDEEKYHAVKRLAENKTGIVNKRWKWNQVTEAVLDPKTWIIFLFNVAINIPNGGLITFGGILIKNLGFSPIQASLLNMPTGVMSTLSAFIFSSLAARWANRRCLVTMLAASVPVIGSLIVYTLKRTDIPAQIIGLYFLYTYFGPYVVGISLAQANTAGHTKKNVQYSILYIGYAVGNLIGPQTFRDTAWMNKRASRARVSATCEGVSVENHIDQFMDKSDFKQVNFKYTT
ncbi:hypothetical protein A7C99_2624 [Trichophyton rubrum]|uniref:Allantoate permease n=1 Tax=Trichophyton rubrum TaxID=5551 RepID=A0A178F242_TRIRU|nr:hypothetical protein A7C99_2624 [Trichophyton rubrum]